MITGTSSQQIKNIMQLSQKAKERRRQGVFLVEGVRMFEEIPRGELVRVYASESFLQKDAHKAKLAGIDYETVSDAVFRHISDTQTPQGILSVVRQPHYELSDLLAHSAPHLLLLETVQDPGNLGTMFRTAEGAGATGIIMNRTCVDLFAPKTVRATMGSIYRVPFYVAEDFEEAILQLKSRNITVYAAHLRGKKYYDAFDYRKGTAFLIGNEGNGLTQETADLADSYLKIPMAGQLESLNAAMAAGILMYEAERQRRLSMDFCM